LDRLADDVWIRSEATLPEAMTQHDHRIGAGGGLFGRQKRTAH
jgi:hypothetical protein